MHVCGRVGKDFFGEVHVVVGKVPDIASIYSREIDTQGGELLVSDKKVERPND